MGYKISEQQLTKMYNRYTKEYMRRSAYSQVKDEMLGKVAFERKVNRARAVGVKDTVKEIVSEHFYSKKQLKEFRPAFQEFAKSIDIDADLAQAIENSDTQRVDLLHRLEEVKNNLNDYITFKAFRTNIDTLMNLLFEYKTGLDKEQRSGYLDNFMYPEEVQVG